MNKFEIVLSRNLKSYYKVLICSPNPELRFWGSISVSTHMSIEDFEFKPCEINWSCVGMCDVETAKEFACGIAYAVSLAKMSPKDFIKKFEYLEANKITTAEYSLT